MRTPAEAVDELVSLVERAAPANDPVSIRTAYLRVLAELQVAPDDPAFTDGVDVVGAAYERLLPGQARRRRGQFFTPLALGRVMARWVLADEPALLADPGCGSGSLLIAAAHERSEATQLLGIDIDPAAVAMARANQSIRALASLEVREGDFLRGEFEERPDAIICNPPYTRHQALSGADKRAIHDALAERSGVRLSQLASLHVLFLLRALEVAADRARLAFITPAHWLDMAYAREVKHLLLEQAHVEAIVTFPSDQPVFEHAITTAAITLIRKGPTERAPTRLIAAASADAAGLSAQLADPEAGKAVTLASTRKWSRARSERRAKDSVPLSDFAAVHRGAATGHNAYFVISERRRRELRLARCSLRPCLPSPRRFGDDEVTSEALEDLGLDVARWLLNPRRPHSRGPLADYLESAKGLGVRDRYLVRQREKHSVWYRIEFPYEAPILFSYFNRTRARFVRNRAGAVPLNNWLVVEPREGVDADDLFEILTGDAIRTTLQADSRIYGNGLWKLEPSELESIRLPRAPRSLPGLAT